MDKKNIVFKGSSEQDLFEQFIAKCEDEDIYSAMIIFNRMKNIKPECFLYKASFYSKLGEISLEVNELLKVLTITNYNKYNIKSLLMRLNMYFYVYNGLDVFEYYKKMVLPRFLYDQELMLLENPIAKNKEKKSLKLVQSVGKQAYMLAVEHLEKEEYDKAIKVLSEIPSSDPDYVKAQNMIAIINMYYKKDNEKSNESIKKALDSSIQSPQVYERLYSTLKFDDKYKQEAAERVLEEEYDEDDYDGTLLTCLVLCDKGEYKSAEKELKKIRGIEVFSAKYLKRLMLIQYKLDKIKELESTLKKYVSIYPRDAHIRFALLKIMEGKQVNIEEFIEGRVNKATIKEMAELVINAISTIENINSLTKNEAEFIINLAMFIEDNDLINATALAFMETQHKDVVLECLYKVDTDPVARQLIFQAFLECCYIEPLYVLVNGLLVYYELVHPQLFTQKMQNIDEEKMKYLKVVYSQIKSLLIFAGCGYDNFCSIQDKLFNYLYENDIEKNELMINANNIVYALSMIFTDNNKEIERSFRYIKDSTKKEIVKIFNEIMKNIKVDI